MADDALMADVSRVVGECAGAVSMCWEPNGEFDSTQAAAYVDGAIARLSSVLSAEEGRIRADEREKVAREEAQIYARAWDEVSDETFRKVNAYDALRAQVEALPCHTDDPLVNDAVERADVLDLLGSESDD